MSEFKIIIGVIGGTISVLLGGWDLLLKCLLFLMITDILAGFFSAAYYGKSKYSTYGISSDALLRGAIRKMFMMVMVSLAVVMDALLEMDYIRNCVCMYFIATEGLSLIEHAANMGVPLPAFLRNILELIRKQAEGQGNALFKEENDDET